MSAAPVLIVFRVDANPLIGTGHLMRCTALANAMAASGARCLFLCRDAGLGVLAQRIAGAGHELVRLPDFPEVMDADDVAAMPRLAHSHWLPGGWQADARACLAALADHPRPDWLVVDHYALDARWQRELRCAVQKVMVIDDLADRDHDCDLLLDQNHVLDNDKRYASRIPTGCASLLGPRYALLRPEFAAQREAALERALPAQAERVLVMFGGADSQDLTRASVELLAGLGFAGHVDVVAGPLYRPLEALRACLSSMPSAALHVQPANVGSLMAQADLAIGSPGVTSWERCVLGLPTLAIAVADNQQALAEALAIDGGHAFLGRFEQLPTETFAAALRHLLGNRWARLAMRRAAATMCDGAGCTRVARRLLAGHIHVRPAIPTDAPLVFAWRNDERVRRYALDPAPLRLDGHLAWFAQTLADPERALLLALRRQTPVGCIRLDRQDRCARVSIFLDPDLIGQGLGASVLRAAEAWAGEHWPTVDVLQAQVVAGNEASARSFVGAGYALAHSVFALRLAHRRAAETVGDAL